MKIMVFDVPAEAGGALSVLNDFYKEATSCEDKNIEWIFVISTPFLQETENIKVLRFPWVKKSWGHRLYFDNIFAPRLVRKHKVDKILSLQNIVVPNVDVPQILYVHQPLPFASYRFSFMENKLFWIYQNIIGKKIIDSIKKADKVIVQTEWMKRACAEKAYIKDDKIFVVAPNINMNIKNFFEANQQSLSTFFYPASGLSYKNHNIVLEACKKLKEKGIKEFKVIFTLKGNENNYIKNLYNEVKAQKLPIEFVGSLTREQVFDSYTRSVLIFPSYIETFGLPLLEAKLHKGIIFASDCPFSHEILDGYENAYFFEPFNERELVRLMSSSINKELEYSKHFNFENDKEIFKKNMIDIITRGAR